MPGPYGVRMIQADVADTTTTTAPRQRRKRTPVPAATFTEPDGYAAAHRRFEVDAQQLLLGRPDRTIMMPDDLAAVVALGLPCRTCGASVYQDGDANHTVRWTRDQEKQLHWAAGITATCPGAVT